MKIVVYAICKDEESLIERWWKSVKEADEVIVLDTGSTDGSVELLRKLGATVYEDYEGEFRFDRARNIALSHVPEDADYCFSVDIDEVFEPGWRRAIEDAANTSPAPDMIRYPFVFDHRIKDDGTEENTNIFYKNNCHRRRGFRWVSPCHEVLISDLSATSATAEGCVLHHRTVTKERRGMYLEILERGAKEEPNDSRIHYYLGREYMYIGAYKMAIDTLVKYAELAGQYCWHDEKGNALYYIAKCYQYLGDNEKAEIWALRAIAETSGREPYIFLARIYYNAERWHECRYYAEESLKIEDNHAYFRDPEVYGAYPYDLICVAAYRLGDRRASREAAAKCVELEPGNKRFYDNYALFKGESRETPVEKSESEGITVAYSVTEEFLDKLEVALYSLLRHNNVKNLYLFTDNGKESASVNRLAKFFGVQQVYWLNLTEALNEFLVPTCPNWSPTCSRATLGRLFLGAKTNEEKILYLDCDTIVKGDLSELWKTDVTGYAIAGVFDQGAIYWQGDYTKTLVYGGIPKYLNAGVLLMNLKYMRENGTLDTAISELNQCYYQLADQDVLNIAANGRTKTLDNKWNSCVTCGYSENPVIDHFVSHSRFWEDSRCKSWISESEEYERWKNSNLISSRNI